MNAITEYRIKKIINKKKYLAIKADFIMDLLKIVLLPNEKKDHPLFMAFPCFDNDNDLNDFKNSILLTVEFDWNLNCFKFLFINDEWDEVPDGQITPIKEIKLNKFEFKYFKFERGKGCQDLI